MKNIKTSIKHFCLAVIVSLCIAPIICLAAAPAIQNPFDNLQIAIPGLTSFSQAVTSSAGITNTWLAEYISAIYKYAIGILGIVAMLAVAVGGALWVVSSGVPARVSEAKSWVSGGLIGLALGLSSYLMLTAINPDLTNYQPLTTGQIIEKDIPGFKDYQNMNQGLSKTAPTNVTTVTIDTLSGPKAVQIDVWQKDSLIRVANAAKAAGFNIATIGGYRSSPNCHGEGRAVDINFASNYCTDCYKSKGTKIGNYYHPAGLPGAGQDYQVDPLSLTEQIVTIFQNEGWCWGGDWRSFKDYMHFSKGCTHNECGRMGQFNFSQSVKDNQAAYGITL